MKKNQVGYKTEKSHDTLFIDFSKESSFSLLSKIEIYHNQEGIYGFFPFYNNKKKDDLIKKSSFYNGFNINHKFNLMSSSISKSKPTKFEEVSFKFGEVITYVKGFFDEEKKVVSALLLKTNLSTYSFGKVSMLNNKQCFVIEKDDHFIAGLKSTFLTDKGSCDLSYIGVVFDDNDNYLKRYFKDNGQSRIIETIQSSLLKSEKVFFSVLRILLVILLCLYPLYFLYSRSQNLYGGDIFITNSRLKDDFLLKTSKIHTDSHGFAHIKSDSISDAMFSLGFVHGRDRLWQIDLIRRVQSGRLSEVFGRRTLECDVFMRKVFISSAIENKLNTLKQSKYINLIYKYIDGINYFANNFILPPEYHLLSISWSEYTLYDYLHSFNFISFSLSSDWFVEIAYKHIEEGISKEFADLIFSIKLKDTPFGEETIISDEELIEMGLHKSKQSQTTVIDDVDEKKILEMKNKQQRHNEAEASIKENHIEEGLENLQVSQGASNSWVISGKYTNSGFPILSNDPHLPNTIPSSFYAVKIYLHDNIISGCSYPGIVMIASGSNNDSAWGVTAEASDMIDICEEKIEGETYIFDDKKYNLSKKEERIQIKNEDDYVFQAVWTKNGGIIKDVYSKISPNKLSLNIDNQSISSISNISFRVSWLMNKDISFDIAFDLLQSKSFKDIENSVSKVTYPSINLIYSNKKGEFIYTKLGNIPLKNSQSSNLYSKSFCKGWSLTDEITESLSYDKSPKLFNPRKGYIVTANNKVVSDNFKYEFSGMYQFTRAYRIKEMIEDKLSKNEKFSIEDNINMLKDVKDVAAERILPKLISIYERNKVKQYDEFKKHVQKVQEYQQIAQSNPNFEIPKSNYEPPQSIVLLEHLRKWNYTMESDSQLASIYTILEYQIGINLFGNFSPYIANSILSTRSIWGFIYSLIEKVYSNSNVDLKACSFLSGSKDCEKYLVKVIDNLPNILNDEFPNKHIPLYGDLKQIVYPHRPFDENFLLKHVFSRKGRSRGSKNTVKVGHETYTNPNGKFVNNYSPSCQFVCDLSKPNEPLINISLGNSGNLLSRHYDDRLKSIDLAELVVFQNYEFKEEADLRTLVLSPRIG